MKDKDFSVAEIKELMTAMHRAQMGKLKIENGDYKITLEGCERTVVTEAQATAFVPAINAITETTPVMQEGDVVTSPIVGTFYEAPAPDAKPFVKIGAQVKKGDVLFIIESMKLMNEVQSQFEGTVSEIHVKSGQGVEFGQPIMTII